MGWDCGMTPLPFPTYHGLGDVRRGDDFPAGWFAPALSFAAVAEKNDKFNDKLRGLHR